ncbi:hypothetical protein MRX96_007399 [Rhipicephalus microplus]
MVIKNARLAAWLRDSLVRYASRSRLAARAAFTYIADRSASQPACVPRTQPVSPVHVAFCSVGPSSAGRLGWFVRVRALALLCEVASETARLRPPWRAFSRKAARLRPSSPVARLNQDASETLFTSSPAK